MVSINNDIPTELNGLTFHYDVDFSNNIHDFMNNLNYNIKCDFGLSTFEIIPRHLGENGLDLKQHLMNQHGNNYEFISIGQFIENDAGFYIRPISLTNEDIESMREIEERLIHSRTCPICITRNYNMSRYFNCEHEICSYCFANWNSRMVQENRQVTCPLCRRN
jgi:hypothetical protein